MSTVEWKYSKALDQLRFFAASMVILAHFKPPFVGEASNVFDAALRAWADNGKAGVSLFLVLSGFLFTMNYEGGDKPVAYKPFILRRIWRIMPMYVLVMLLIMAQGRAEWTVLDLLTFALFQVNTGDAVNGYANAVLPFAPIWTIAVEFQFYLLFPFLIAVIKPSDWRRMLALMGVFIFFRLLLGALDPVEMYYKSYHTLLGRMDQFLIGMMAAAAYRNWGAALTPRLGWAMVGAGVLLLSAWFVVFRLDAYPLNQLSFTIEALIMAVVLIGYHVSGGIGSILGRGVTVLGQASYSIYLLHLLVASVFVIQFEHLPLFQNYGLKLVGLVLLPTFAISLLTYYAIEKPFNSLSRRAR